MFFPLHLKKKISFAAGDGLRVKDKSSAEWWWCINAYGEEGYAPANYIAITPKVRDWDGRKREYCVCF
jgi:hypothetical protein